MIPYIEQPGLDLGLIHIHAFGALVAAALLIGLEIFRRRSARAGLDAAVGSRLAGWILVGGLLGAHLVDRLFYNFGETLSDPLSLLILWEGISSYGGLIGGTVGAWLFLRRNPQGPNSWRYLDAVAYAVPFAFVLGRLGCFLAFDHVGAPTTFVLGQEYVDGVVRHNMGLEEALYWVVIATVTAVFGRTARRPGFFVGLVAVLYAPGRFLLDFLRISDERYAGLIVSQYASILVFAIGVWVLLRVVRSRPKATTAGRRERMPRSARSKAHSPALVFVVLALVLSVGGGLAASYIGQAPDGTPSHRAVADEIRSERRVGELRPSGLRIVPTGRSDAAAVLPPEQFTGRVRNAYWIATQIPEVLNQLYCWCGCIDRGEHRSSLQCFEDMMGVTCEVCQRTAEIAYEMVHSGTHDAGQIQARVDAELAPPAESGPEMTRDMRVIHGLLAEHRKIERAVEDIPGGVRTTTTSADPQVAGMIRQHVRQMKERVDEAKPIRVGDPLFREIFKHSDAIEMQVEPVPGGVRVTETSDDPQVVLLIRQHARRAVSEFVEQGPSRARELTPLPEGYTPRSHTTVL